MAEANDNSDTGEEFLKCPICLEFYVDPKFLPCLHTFCRSCLQTYISSSIKEEEISESKTKVDFPCPVCRTIVTSPYSGEIEIEDLSSKFPTHQTINSLLDKHNLEANVTYCNSCLVEKRENPAKTWCKVCNEAFCEECTKWHRKITALKSHKLTQLSDMNINEMDITRLEFCDIHKDEVLRAFCKDHEKACCLPCLTIEHRKCVDVINLEEAAAGIKEMEETQEFLKRLRESEQFLSEMLRKRKQNISNLETRKNNILAEITAFRKRLDKHFDNLEDKLKEDVVSKQKTSLLEEKEYISDLESKYATILNYRKLLEACLNKASEIHNFLEIKRLINKTKMFGKELKSCADDMKEIDLEMCFQAEIQNVVSTLSLGTVEVRVKSPKINTDFLNSKIFADSRVCKILSFQLPKTIQSATFLKNGNLIIAMDRLFVCFDENGEKARTKVEGATSLNGVTVLMDDTILLSRPGKSTVYEVDTKSNVLQWKFGIRCDNIVNTGNLVIAACETHVAVLDFKGNIKQKIPVRGNKVQHIAHHGEIIYYTISDEDAVRAVSLTGKHGFEYKNADLKDPRGIDTDTQGNIYVAGYASSNVHQISKDGQLLNIILTDIVNPNVICVSKTGDRLLVSHSESKVNVYELF